MAWSETWTFFNGDWHEGNPPILGPRSHGFWLASSVFDGGRVFEGRMPDIELHAKRVIRSAAGIGLNAPVDPDTIIGLAHDGVKKFAPGTALYVKPMIWGEGDKGSAILPDPDDSRFLLCLFAAPMPEPKGGSITLSPFRRPTIECMPTDSKAGCLYPNNARALREAKSRGFDNALVRDFLGNVAELTTANVFMAKDGVVYTPEANSSFLNGITRQRVIQLLRDSGVTVVEKSLTYADFEAADEIFQSGNYAKVLPITRIDSRDLQPGPFFAKAREAYWAYAHGG
ncbi:branched-chain amino acid aminotransferase [Rhabdaerophilum sp. SD176]|uniref:branched-chain amino acid aminotransferase n=1 Tax=Rhabdaerophilum sp. SD176 TaxID=2983548 RepID=UPI0024DF3FE2|nr:branched-chain amino acid aminotransferase [Rhabdaerophilum sp. SD176]